MPTFDALYTEFENTKDVCDFCEKYSDDNVATRFLLIRSLDKPNLVDIMFRRPRTIFIYSNGGIISIKGNGFSAITTDCLFFWHTISALLTAVSLKVKQKKSA